MGEKGCRLLQVSHMNRLQYTYRSCQPEMLENTNTASSEFLLTTPPHSLRDETLLLNRDKNLDTWHDGNQGLVHKAEVRQLATLNS